MIPIGKRGSFVKNNDIHVIAPINSSDYWLNSMISSGKMGIQAGMVHQYLKLGVQRCSRERDNISNIRHARHKHDHSFES